MPKQAEIISITPIAPNVHQFRLKILDAEEFPFKAGQFITLELPIHEKRHKRFRSYSIVSAPQDNSSEIDLCIVRAQDGDGTYYLFEDAKVGTVLPFKGPDGAFVLPRSISERPLVMICTGTGIAPFKSMIETIKKNNLPHRELHLIFGTRFESGILYRNEWEELERNTPGFKFEVALSREKTTSYHHGYIHPLYEKIIAENKLENPLFYLCGWKNMIDDTALRLLELGVKREDIVFELYG